MEMKEKGDEVLTMKIVKDVKLGLCCFYPPKGAKLGTKGFLWRRFLYGEWWCWEVRLPRKTFGTWLYA